MKRKNLRLGAVLSDALDEVPKIGRALSNKPGKYHEATYLELAAAEMTGGEGQGSSFFCYVPPKTGRKIIEAAQRIIEEDLRAIGVPIHPTKGRAR